MIFNWKKQSESGMNWLLENEDRNVSVVLPLFLLAWHFRFKKLVDKKTGEVSYSPTLEVHPGQSSRPLQFTKEVAVAIRAILLDGALVKSHGRISVNDYDYKHLPAEDNRKIFLYSENSSKLAVIKLLRAIHDPGLRKAKEFTDLCYEKEQEVPEEWYANCGIEKYFHNLKSLADKSGVLMHFHLQNQENQ